MKVMGCAYCGATKSSQSQIEWILLFPLITNFLWMLALATRELSFADQPVWVALIFSINIAINILITTIYFSQGWRA